MADPPPRPRKHTYGTLADVLRGRSKFITFEQFYGVPEPKTPGEATALMLDVANKNKTQHVLRLIGELVNDRGADVEAVDSDGRNVPLMLIDSGQLPVEGGSYPLENLRLFDWMRESRNNRYAALEYARKARIEGVLQDFRNSYSNEENPCNIDKGKLAQDWWDSLTEAQKTLLGEVNPPESARALSRALSSLESQSSSAETVYYGLNETYYNRGADPATIALALLRGAMPGENNAGAPVVRRLMEAGKFAEITDPKHWVGREQDFLELAAAMPASWRERLKTHPLMQGKWQRTTDRTIDKHRYTAQELLDTEGKPNLQLLTLVTRDIPRHFLFSEYNWQSEGDMKQVLNAMPERYQADGPEVARSWREWSLARPSTSVLVEYMRPSRSETPQLGA